MSAVPAAVAPYRILVRDRFRAKIGEVQRLTALSLTPRFCDVGSWSITIPRGHRQADLLATEGNWVTFLLDDGSEICSGQVRGLQEGWDDTNPGAGTLTAYGPSAEVVLSDRLAYQVPGSVATSQSATDYDRRTGAAETVLKAYVNVNAGPGALLARQIDGLTVETDLGRGTSVKGSARMDNLLTLLQPLATSGGVGFRVVITAVDALQFQVYVPADRSGTARFGVGLGNLQSYQRVREAGKSTDVVVGGGGDGTARLFRETVDAQAIALWGNRSETFLDRRDTTDTTELDQAAAEETVNNGPTNALTIKTIDTPHLRFGRDYFMGDIVSLPEFGVVDRITEADIAWTADAAPSTTTTVGTTSTTGTSKMITALAALNSRVAALEAAK